MICLIAVFLSDSFVVFEESSSLTSPSVELSPLSVWRFTFVSSLAPSADILSKSRHIASASARSLETSAFACKQKTSGSGKAGNASTCSRSCARLGFVMDGVAYFPEADNAKLFDNATSSE